RAPVLIAVAQARDAALSNPELDLEDYGATCAAVQNLLLAATAEGLTAKWSTGDMATNPVALAHLGLAETDRIVALVSLGVAEPTEDDKDTEPIPPRRSAPIIDWRS